MKKAALAAAILAALVGTAHARAGTVVTVMTRNLYFGTDLAPVVAAPSQSQFFAAVATAYNEAQTSNFSGRLNRVADEIAVTRPDLVGLQEAVQWRTQFPADFIPLNAQTDAGNFVQILLNALAARGLDYVVASEATGYDVEAPGAFPGPFPLFTDVRLTQHEVILARRGLSVSNARSGRYSAADFIPSVVGPIVLPWAWASVDVTKYGQAFRFATTHLDSNATAGATQQAQAQEFLGGPANTSLPLVWVGDFNSAAAANGATDVPPDTPTHTQVVAAGFTDAWAATRGDDPGYTCCNAENLLNPTPTYTNRIDYVFSRGAVRPIAALRVGVLPIERISTGQWPSDHAGVYAALVVG